MGCDGMCMSGRIIVERIEMGRSGRARMAVPKGKSITGKKPRRFPQGMEYS